MNKKGLYSGGVALATVVMVIAVSFNIASTVQAGESQGKADAILNAKWEAQNIGYLLETAAVDAMIDEIFVACSYDEDLIRARISSYVLGHNPVGQEGCTASNINVSGGSPNTAINFELECQSSAATGLTINYKKTITLNKTADITPNGTQCTVIIDDLIARPFGYGINITGDITG